MVDILITVLFFWLFFKAIGLFMRLTWGITKIIASLLFSIALPLLIGCLLFAGGLVILVPLGLIGLALGLLKSCV